MRRQKTKVLLASTLLSAMVGLCLFSAPALATTDAELIERAKTAIEKTLPDNFQDAKNISDAEKKDLTEVVGKIDEYNIYIDTLTKEIETSEKLIGEYDATIKETEKELEELQEKLKVEKERLKIYIKNDYKANASPTPPILRLLTEAKTLDQLMLSLDIWKHYQEEQSKIYSKVKSYSERIDEANSTIKELQETIQSLSEASKASKEQVEETKHVLSAYQSKIETDTKTLDLIRSQLQYDYIKELTPMLDEALKNVPPEEQVIRKSLVRTAISTLGTPYRWGSSDYSSGGFDCSGMVCYSYGQNGYNLVRSSAQQYATYRHINASDALPGDLAFQARGGRIYHVLMYIGGGLYIEAPYEGKTVSITNMSGRSIVGFASVL